MKYFYVFIHWIAWNMGNFVMWCDPPGQPISKVKLFCLRHIWSWSGSLEYWSDEGYWRHADKPWRSP